MMTPKECADAWKTVVKIYKETRDETPTITMQEIIKELGQKHTKEVFATVAAIKKYDGRIYGRNREIMNATEYNYESSAWERGNPMIYAGLDDIHTEHINQLITELIELTEK